MYKLIFLDHFISHSVITEYQACLKETNKGRFINFLEST